MTPPGEPAGTSRCLAPTRRGTRPGTIATCSGRSRLSAPEEIHRKFHALRVHQIELELQNEELRQAQAEIETGRAFCKKTVESFPRQSSGIQPLNNQRVLDSRFRGNDDKLASGSFCNRLERERFIGLDNLAPVGHRTLSAHRMIKEAIRWAATMQWISGTDAASPSPSANSEAENDSRHCAHC